MNGGPGRARVKEAHTRPEGEEIRVYPGDPVRVGAESLEYPGWVRVTTAAGRSSWIPEAYVRERGSLGTVVVEYDSRELAARGGEIVTLVREIRGWAWVRAEEGREGWLPLRKLDIFPAAPAE